MRYYVPILRLAAELPAQSAPVDKLGGLPWGLPVSLWPCCRSCGKSQSLLAQLLHHPDRLDLGRPGRVLSVFQCSHDPGACPTWEGGSGANACVVSEPEELTQETAALPEDLPPVEREARIVEWSAREDGITPAEAARFVAEDYYDLPESVVDKVAWSTRLGGLPRWLQSPEEAPAGDWRFLGQLDSTYSFHQAPEIADPGVREDPERYEGRSHYCEGPNFGDGGLAYLFLRQSSGRPEGWFFWQCG